jgi:outer membrane protein OmpA-like peptidoglycan-associated protein
MVSFTKTAKTFGENGSVSRTEARVLQDLASKGQLDAAGQAQLKALLEGARFENADDRAALQNVLGKVSSKEGAPVSVDTRDLYSPVPGLRNDGVRLSKTTTENLQRLLETDPAAYELAVTKINGMPKDAVVNLSVSKTTPTSEANLPKQMAAWDKEIAKDRAALTETLGRKPKKEDQDVFDLAVHYKSTTKETKAATSGNAEAVAAANKDIAAWNARYASTFAFDNDVGGAVNNAGPSQEAVQALADVLKKHEGVLQGATITLGGHTSTPGSDAHNKRLSEQRAGTVQTMLDKALPPELKGKLTVQAAGYGESRPLVQNDNTEALQQQNRRVEAAVTFAPHVIDPTPAETASTTTGEVFRLTAYPDLPDPRGGGRSRPPREHPRRPLNPHKAIPCPRFD